VLQDLPGKRADWQKAEKKKILPGQGTFKSPERRNEGKNLIGFLSYLFVLKKEAEGGPELMR